MVVLVFTQQRSRALEMAPGWRDFHRQPDPGAVDYQSGETPVGEPAPAIPVVPAKILGPRVGVGLRWSLACPLDDGAHLLSVERLHGLGPNVAEGANL